MPDKIIVFFSEDKISPCSIPLQRGYTCIYREYLQRCLSFVLAAHLAPAGCCVCWMWGMMAIPTCPLSQMAQCTNGVSSTSVPISGWMGPQEISTGTSFSEQGQLWDPVTAQFDPFGFWKALRRRHNEAGQSAPLPGPPHRGIKLFDSVWDSAIPAPHTTGKSLAPSSWGLCHGCCSRCPKATSPPCWALPIPQPLLWGSSDHLRVLHRTCSGLVMHFLYWPI